MSTTYAVFKRQGVLSPVFNVLSFTNAARLNLNVFVQGLTVFCATKQDSFKCMFKIYMKVL
jgi:hypothetical protein